MTTDRLNSLVKDVEGFMGSNAQRSFMYFLGKITTTAAEIGSFKGLSACIVGLGMDDGDIPMPKYYCIDTFEASNKELNDESTLKTFLDNVKGLGIFDYIHPVVGNSRDVNTVGVVGERLQWLYVDGSHETEDIVGDVLHWKDLVMEDGLILFHDYPWATVKQAIDICVGKGWIEKLFQIDDLMVTKKV